MGANWPRIWRLIVLKIIKMALVRDFLEAQCLGLYTSTTGSPCSITGQGTKIPKAVQCSKTNTQNADQTAAWSISRWLWELTVAPSLIPIQPWRSPLKALAHCLSVGGGWVGLWTGVCPPFGCIYLKKSQLSFPLTLPLYWVWATSTWTHFC